uniref:Uncharacterized protein n=1 Tax=Meloidogyne incognita TaxID=6306 RepID=A0A914L6S5_MELIC
MKLMNIGLEKCGTHERIKFTPRMATVYDENDVSKLDNTCWITNDIFGFGLVYPPTHMMNEWPYIFITKNGKQIGRHIRTWLRNGQQYFLIIVRLYY